MSYLNDWEVLTDGGWSDFEGLKIIESDIQIHVKLERTELICSVDHKIMTTSGWIESQKLKVGSKCLTIDGLQRVVSVSLKERSAELYDLVGVTKGSRYYTNDILSHNCDEFAHLKPNLADEFIASVFPTLSSSESSKLIIISTPNGLNHYHKLWVEAQNGNNDFACVEGNWKENPKRNQTWADKQRQKLGEVKYRQEIECISGETSVSVRDTISGKIFSVSIEDLYSRL